MSSPVVLGAEFVQNRQALYDRLFAEGSVCRAVQPDGLQVWVVAGYADARQVLADPALSKDSRRAAPLHDQQEQQGVQRTVLAEALTAHMLNLDPPDHTRLRRLIGREFTMRRVEALRPWIERVADGLIEQMAGQDRVELLTAFAFPLSVTVIGELFGVPAVDRDRFRALSGAIAFGTDPAATGRASEEMAEYLNDLVAQKRSTPADDLLSALVRARDEEERLTEIELVSMAFVMLTAGFETTGHLIGNGILSLLCNPEVLLGGANRDASAFEHPERLDVHRGAPGHIAFGHGIHHCVGAPLARLEGQVAIGRLLERFPDMALAVEPGLLRWRDSVLFHGLAELPLTLTPAPTG